MISLAGTFFNSDRMPIQALNSATIFWFLVVAFGQWLFAAYILGFYGVSALQGDLYAWNDVLPEGYNEGDTLGNLMLGSHLLLAVVISIAGPLQLMPAVRAYRSFHRWNGRIYLFAALILSASGLYLELFADRNLAGDLSMSIAITMNAILILVFGSLSLYYALKGRIDIHRRWALRLFLAASGVWFFRIGVMFWLVVNGKPVGFDVESFSGPFLTFLAFLVYVMPAAILEVYLRIQRYGSAKSRLFLAAGLCVLAIVMTIGLFGATLGMWLPKVI